MITVEDIKVNLLSSLFYFLRNEIYTKGGTNNTLLGFYSGLSITVGFPDDLRIISLPTISLEGESRLAGIVETFSPTWKPVPFVCSIYGFAGGEETEPGNKELRDKLTNDIHALLEDTEEIDFCSDAPTYAVTDGVMEISDVVSRSTPQVGELSAEKYRFVVDFIATLTIKER